MRDKELDIIKGLACILMIFAHAGTLGRTIDNSFTTPFWYLGFFAPILFFASIGVSSLYQLKKRSVEKIIIFNILLFFISFSDIGKQSLNYLDITKPNLIGSLAIATIFSLFWRKVNGLLILFLLLGLDRLANRFPLTPTVIYGIPFALIPWAGIISLGKYLHENKKSRILILVIGSLITLYYIFVKHQTIQTQFLTSLFLGVSLLIYSLTTLSAETIGKIPLISSILTYLGRNTLLFYWFHLFLLFTINLRLFAPLMWIFILILTISCMLILQKVNHYTIRKFSQTVWFWLIFISAIFVPLIWHFSQQIQFYFFSILTIIFALNYRQFLQLRALDRIEQFIKL